MSKAEKRGNLIIVLLVMLLLGIGIALVIPKPKNEFVHVGIAIYNMEDEYMADMVYQLEDEIRNYDFRGKKVVFEVLDAKNNANTQEKQLQYLLSGNFDVLVVNMVKPTSAANILNRAVSDNIPVILFNRETDERDMIISNNVWYVGTDGYMAGVIQGKMIKDAWEDAYCDIDKNNNGTIDYILVEGEATHFDTISRTNGFLETVKDLKMNQIATLSADWNRKDAYEKLAELDSEIIEDIEVVVCNNDDMALGVLDYFSDNHREFPLIVGINNRSEVNKQIKNGSIYGTVDNNVKSQISRICSLLNDIMNGETGNQKQVWYSEPFGIK
ncbi:substrate-binding domain-containing protein [Anaerosacchariphilus polymeriproducens]|nr:substrate-binding domain-containing protein [Anaerosacchariphilus polymeriproducens]